MAITYETTKKQTINLSLLSDVIQNVMNAMKTVFGSKVRSASAIEQAIYQAYHVSDDTKKVLIRQELIKSHNDLFYT